MASSLPARSHTRVLTKQYLPPKLRQYLPTDLYRDPWENDPDAKPVDRLVLATWRADQLAAHLAARLEAVSRAIGVQADGSDTATHHELHALSLCASHIRQFLADVTREAGAYVEAPPER